MLKKFFLGNKEIPIPLPISNLGEALQWIDKAFVKDGMVLTSFVLDGESWVDRLQGKEIYDVALNPSSRLDVKIESAQSISVQILQTISDLSFVVQRKMLEIGVDCWESGRGGAEYKLSAIMGDIKLLLDLVDHINGIMDYSHEEMAALNALSHLVRVYYHQLIELSSEKKFQKIAHILVNRLDSCLKELVLESGNLQIHIISSVKREDEAPFLPGFEFQKEDKVHSI
ncbi:MAG: hypothetical protein KA436_05985 [Oligoflexales bacterium]|nr:hypothetical protein [Oligoflexales bacterium]